LGCYRSGDVQLSLRRSAIRSDNPDVYVGYKRKNGDHVRYALSLSPSSYVWHCHACNAPEGNAVALFDAMQAA